MEESWKGGEEETEQRSREERGWEKRRSLRERKREGREREGVCNDGEEKNGEESISWEMKEDAVQKRGSKSEKDDECERSSILHRSKKRERKEESHTGWSWKMSKSDWITAGDFESDGELESA